MELTKEAFSEQVKDALQHLYDVAYLPRLELAQLLTDQGEMSWDERSQALRRQLIQAIDRLDPGPGLPFTARERRSFTILSARYARSMTSQEVMDELAISERQYWREHKKAIDALVDLLWQGDSGSPVDTAIVPSGEDRDAVAREEAGLMTSHSTVEEVNGGEIIRQVAWALQKVTDSRGINLRLDISDPPPLVFADRIILRQICLNLISYAYDITADKCVSLELSESLEGVQLIVTTAMQEGCDVLTWRTGLGLNIVRQLVESQNGRYHVEMMNPCQWVATINLHQAQRVPILVIDDNQAIINLFQRYLAGSRFRVIGAESGQKALQLASQVKPAAITLDVMMPTQDGWETLQALRAIPEMLATPIIICSILNEPGLAYSLGANDFIRKPVNRLTLLHTLENWTPHLNRMAPMNPEAPEGI
jgi:CheY-like chemotaxis protein